MCPRIAFIFTILLFWLIIVSPTIATPNNEITVCSTGCDYAAIQPAIDAATSGDQIIVAAGVYTEQLTLRSGITLTAQNGPLTTLITALASPIISGSDIYSVTVQGFSIQGSPIVSISNGIVLTNSSVMISNVIIGNLYGANGTISNANGLTAIGLQISGTFSVTVFNSIIENIVGGNAHVDSSGQGGDGIGIAAYGDGQLLVLSSTIHSVVGGAAGLAWAGVSWCDGVGGSSIGILKKGPGYLGVEHSKIEGLLGGAPCHPNESSYPCLYNSGNTIAIQTIGGTLDVQDSLITNNSVWASESNSAVTGIVASNATRISVQNNKISSLAMIGAITSNAIAAPESPFCYPNSGSVVGMLFDTNYDTLVEGNAMQNLHGAGLSGQASGLYAHGSQYITVTNNQISDLIGGSNWNPQNLLEQATYGILIEDGTRALLDANRISQLYGGQSEVWYLSQESGGGEVVGLQVISTTESSITNNMLDSLIGGNGSDFPPVWPGDVGSAGNAIGLRIDGGTCNVQNNTVYFMQGGERRYISDTEGLGIGIRLDRSLNAFVTNNTIISSTIGVSATTSNYLWDYNALWHNIHDYTGIITGPHDLHRDPAFADPFNGDFHLRFGSPLIDAGFNIGAADHDIDGNLRPLDGNYDGQAQTDIGAYEYQPVKPSNVYLPLVVVMSH